MDKENLKDNILKSSTLRPDINIVVEIPIGSYGYIIDGETPENVVGLITRGIETCCGITMQTNNEKNIYFLAHITQATDIEDENFGLLNWIKICQEKLKCTEIENLKIEIHHGKNDTESQEIGTDYATRIRNILDNSKYKGRLQIKTHQNSGDACLILRDQQKKELEAYMLDFYKITTDTTNESNKRKKFIIESRNAHSKAMLNYLGNNKSSCTFMQPNGNELINFLQELKITLSESELPPNDYQTKIIEKLFKTRTVRIPTGCAANPTIQVETYPLIEYYSGKPYTNGVNIIKNQYRTVLKNQNHENQNTEKQSLPDH